jgi:hypothetical protein
MSQDRDLWRALLNVVMKIWVLVEWLPLLLHMWEIPSSSLSLEPSYFDRLSMVLLSSSKQMLGWYLILGHKLPSTSS